MTDPTRLAEIRARVEAATPGPWTSWSRRVSRPFTGNGDEDLIGADGKFVNVRDATFIAHSREDVPYLLDLVASLTAERDEYRRALRYLVGNEWEESAGDTLSEKAMSTVIDRQAAELSRLRAVIEEARGMHDEPAAVNPGLCGMCMDARPCDTFSILDRGLKGAGE